MKNIQFFLFACVFCGHIILASGQPYDARTGEKEILTPHPLREPRINGPKIYGARPGKEFIYRIPCQGERPVEFEVKGIPQGINLDPGKGILTGKAPAQKGEYTMTVTARNKFGKTSRLFTLIVGEKIALTPPTGWNSWGGHMIHVTDETIRKAAEVFETRGLADAGFQYIGIDDCWMRTSPEMYANRSENTKNKHRGFDYTGITGEIRDPAGNILPNVNFPDMKALTDYIHSFGLKAGLYSTPGPTTCQNFAGSYDHEEQDARQYARWGFDLLKYDQCSAGKIINQLKKESPGFTADQFWKPMSDYLLKQERDILYNLCQYGQDEPWKWASGLSIPTWRIGGDLNVRVNTYFDQALRIAVDLREYSKPGQWNDPDFMYIHRIKSARDMAGPSVEIPLNTNQRYQYVTLWTIISAPFFFSCDINEIDDFTIGLLSNADVVNINQDELGHVAKVVRNASSQTVMVKELADGSKALAVFNRDPEKEAVVEVKWEEIGGRSRKKVYDVWRQKDLGVYKKDFAVRLSPDGVGFFRIW